MIRTNKICTICGTKYKHQTCPICRKRELWEVRKLNAVKIFPLRVQKNIFKITFPDKYLSTDWDGIYIYGAVSSGKTTLACAIVLNRLRENFMNNVFETALFISTEDFIQQIKNSYDPSSIEKEGVILDRYKDVDLLILDDIGIKKNNDWSYSIYYQLINYRYENLKPTIFTSNIKQIDLADEMQDDRISRRINEMSTKIINL